MADEKKHNDEQTWEATGKCVTDVLIAARRVISNLPEKEHAEAMFELWYAYGNLTKDVKDYVEKQLEKEVAK